MSGIPYFNFYPADFMNGVRGLSPQEVGVYTMLLCRIYEENGPVDLHYLRLYTYCGMRESTFRKVLGKLVELGKLEIRGDCLTNARAEFEISNRADNLKNKKRAGEISAEKRQQKQRAASTGVERVPNDKNTNKNNTPLNPPEGESAARPVSRRSKDQIEKPESIPEQLWSDFLALRRKHRAPVTATAWAGIEREADKAGISFSRAVALCCERGWRGFRADWLKPEDVRAGAGTSAPDTAQAVTLNGRVYTAQSIKRVVFEALTGARTWPADKLGLEPGKPGCVIPPALVSEVRAVIAERSKPKSEIIPFQPRMIA
ncbi:DUF1376 domain-containing protein [Breoghania sp. JC706]|uniref:DUF1376 domain-containing protein n=1 Tax=Breoghania sp. JC706 TaxID=3117732 RepID=UPI003009E5D9